MQNLFQLTKELVGSAMYFANLMEFRTMIQDKIMKMSGWDKVLIVEYSRKKKSFVKSGANTDSFPGGDFYPFLSPFIQKIHATTGAYIRDLSNSKLENYESNLFKEGYRWVCLSPILPRESFAGVMAAYSKSEEKPPIEDLMLLDLTAEVAALSTYIFFEKARNDNLQEKVEDYHDQMLRLEALKIVGELGAGAAGDINNILAEICGYVDLLTERIEDPEIKKVFEQIRRSAEEGRETVRNLQEFKRLDTDSDYEPLWINRIISRALQLTHPIWLDEARARNVEYKMETDVNPAIMVKGHPTALLMAVILIIFKALERLPNGGKIVISANPVGPNVKMKFQIIRIRSEMGVLAGLDPFMQRKEDSHFSLNLSAAGEIFRRHGGVFTKEKVIGSVVEITVKLPLLQEKEPPEQEDEQTTAKAEKGARILVVEDEPLVRKLLQDMLSVEGFKVSTANGGPEALKKIEENKYDLIITDLGMPVMSGLDFTRRVREADSETPIIMATGWEHQVDRRVLGEYKINHIVGKPFQFNKLVTAINRFLAK